MNVHDRPPESPLQNPARRGWALVVCLALLAAAVVGVYHAALDGPFVFDDMEKIVENPAIRQLWPPTWAEATTRPLTQATFAANYAVGGLDPWGFRLTNVLLHGLAASILFLLVRGILQRSFPHETPRWSAGWAFAAAGLWAVHPLSTSAVSYVVQRSEVLASLFYLLILYSLFRMAEADERLAGEGRRSGRWFWCVAAVTAMLLGLASKEIVATAPLVAWLFDRAFLAGDGRLALRKRWPLYLGLTASLAVVPLLLSNGLKAFDTVGFTQSNGLSPGEYLTVQAGVLLHYLRLIVWPWGLSIDYFGWRRPDAWGIVALQGAVVLGLLGLGLRWCWTRPRFGFLVVSFFLLLAPTSSILPIADVAFEHRLYLANAAAVCMLLTVIPWSAAELQRRFAPQSSPDVRQALLVVGLSAVGLLWAGMAYLRNDEYRDRLTLWRATVARRPENARAHDQLAAAYLDAQQYEMALEHAQLSVALAPRAASAHNNLGVALDGLRRGADAAAHYRQAIRLRPDYADAHNNLGNALFAQHNAAGAVEHYRQAVAARPTAPEFHYHLAGAYMRLGRLAPADQAYREAQRLLDQGHARNPELLAPRLASNHGTALAAQGRWADAEARFAQAVQADPLYAEPHFRWGLALKQQFQHEAALPHFQKAAELAPSRPDAWLQLGNALAALGRLPEARDAYLKLLELACCHAEGQYALGIVYFYLHEPKSTVHHFREAVKCEPSWAEAALELGWMLAAHPSPDVRNPDEALLYADRYDAQVGRPSAKSQDLRAAALANAGKFRDAVAAADQALALATTDPPREPEYQPTQIQFRRQLYRTGLPYRMDAPHFTALSSTPSASRHAP